jgi:manganese transport protein
MFRHTSRLQFESRPDKPDPVYAPAGADPVRLLIISQVALSVGLPSALVPLVVLTGRRPVMGNLVNRPVTKAAAWLVVVAVILLNGVLLGQAITG